MLICVSSHVSLINKPRFIIIHEYFMFPLRSHVLHEDTLERVMINDHTIYTKRLMVKRGFGSIPFWLKKVLSNRQEVILEESIIDLKKKEILTSTRNLGGLSRYAVRFIIFQDVNFSECVIPWPTEIINWFMICGKWLCIPIIHYR